MLFFGLAILQSSSYLARFIAFIAFGMATLCYPNAAFVAFAFTITQLWSEVQAGRVEVRRAAYWLCLLMLSIARSVTLLLFLMLFETSEFFRDFMAHKEMREGKSDCAGLIRNVRVWITLVTFGRQWILLLNFVTM